MIFIYSYVLYKSNIFSKFLDNEMSFIHSKAWKLQHFLFKYWQSSCSFIDVVQNLQIDFGAHNAQSFPSFFRSARNDELADVFVQLQCWNFFNFILSFLVSKKVFKTFPSDMNIMWTADIQMKWRYNHRSCDCDWSNRKLSPKTVFGASRGFDPMASALALQGSTNWAMKTHTSGPGQFIELIVPVKWMTHISAMWTADKTERPWVWIPLKRRKHFSGLICDCFNRNHNCDDHIFTSFVHPQFT